MADLKTLARRAVACAGWRWMEGMLGVDAAGAHFRLALTAKTAASDPERYARVLARRNTYVPDLSDPATLGCLLALVREKWAIPTLAPVCKGGVWMFWAGGLPDALYQLRVATEAELLVAALEVQNG